MTSCIRLCAASVLAAAFASPALAAETVAQDMPDPAACTKTINAMGASMGYKPEVAPDGRPVYRYVLRTNGLDYDAVCDAKTGLVNDVTPRAAH